VADNGARLVVFSVPALYDVVPDEMDKISRERIPHPELICKEDVPGYARLQGILADLDIDYINLLPSFRKNMRDEGITLFVTVMNTGMNRGITWQQKSSTIP